MSGPSFQDYLLYSARMTSNNERNALVAWCQSEIRAGKWPRDHGVRQSRRVWHHCRDAPGEAELLRLWAQYQSWLSRMREHQWKTRVR